MSLFGTLYAKLKDCPLVRDQQPDERRRIMRDGLKKVREASETLALEASNARRVALDKIDADQGTISTLNGLVDLMTGKQDAAHRKE